MLSEQIRALRTVQGITQVELAQVLGVTKQSVSNWENDNILPSIDMLSRLADYFGVSTDYLLGRSSQGTLSAQGLTESQRFHIQALINDLLEARG